MPFDGRTFGRHADMLDKLALATDLLRTEGQWCKQELKTIDGRRCILGALMHVGANARLGGVILGAVRELTGKSYRGIESFNDAPHTTHRLVVAVLERSRENILLGKVPAPPMTVERRVRSFYAALARTG